MLPNNASAARARVWRIRGWRTLGRDLAPPARGQQQQQQRLALGGAPIAVYRPARALFPSLSSALPAPLAQGAEEAGLEPGPATPSSANPSIHCRFSPPLFRPPARPFTQNPRFPALRWAEDPWITWATNQASPPTFPAHAAGTVMPQRHSQPPPSSRCSALPLSASCALTNPPPPIGQNTHRGAAW